MIPINRILVYFVLSSIGCSVTSLATFLSIETFFHNVSYLGAALCLRTLSSCLFGYYTNRIIYNIGFKKSFILVQLLCLISSFIIFLGFYYQLFFIVLIGLIMIAFPIVFSNILLTISFRINVKTDTEYRKYSGIRELLFASSRLLACLLTPILLVKFNLNLIFTINIVTTLVGSYFLLNLDTHNLSKDSHLKTPIHLNKLIFHSKDTWIYICQTTSSFLLAALIPILASTSHISLTNEFSPLLRESLWSIETLTMIAGSSLYIFAEKFIRGNLTQIILMLNGIFLIPFLFSTNMLCVLICLMLINASIMVAFYIYRDDYVINAGSNKRVIEAYASFSSVQRDLICSISPVLITYLFANYNVSNTIYLIISLQLFLFILFSLIKKSPAMVFN